MSNIVNKHDVSYHNYADDTQLYIACDNNKASVMQAVKSPEDCIADISEWMVEPGIGGKSPPVTEPQFTTGNRFRLWLIIAIRNSPDARNNRHKPNQTVRGAIIITNGL